MMRINIIREMLINESMSENKMQIVKDDGRDIRSLSVHKLTLIS
jgi:hypothetical protein